MRSNFARTIAMAAILGVTAVGLSACVTHGEDSWHRHGFYDRHDHRWDGRHGWDGHRRDGRWWDRDRDGRRDWWERR